MNHIRQGRRLLRNLGLIWAGNVRDCCSRWSVNPLYESRLIVLSHFSFNQLRCYVTYQIRFTDSFLFSHFFR